MKYIISYEKPHNHYINIEFRAGKINQEELLIQLPSWRPGRYELGNFAKNIQKFAVSDENGNSLRFNKITKDCWKVQTTGISEVRVKYNYFASELNAGSTFLDASQLYMNPVNCCVYIPDRINESCELELILPADYSVAGALAHSPDGKAGEKCFVLSDFHELADTPFIASNSLQHNQFICFGVEFNVWFQGECKPDWPKLTSDFLKFINEQLLVMKEFPSKSYHFLYQILPNKIYHGVEHKASTVIALGPGYELMKENLYEDLLGVSCHELFHAWNIKTIRPIEMQPYDYTKENYSKLGYVCEGVTTYYGDYFLFRSGAYSQEQYFTAFDERMQKHFDNFGRFNLSVADSSYDTWLDGYVPGVPNRKTSIYDEGCLLAFVTDIFIRKNSKNKYSLDDVMLYLYNEFALMGKGYSDTDYKSAVEHFAGASYDLIYYNYISSASDYEPILRDAMEYIGCELALIPAAKFHESSLGVKASEVNGACRITAVYPNSAADSAGISVNDEVLSVNGMQIRPDGSGTNFMEWCNYFGNIPFTLTVSSSGIVKQLKIIPQLNQYYKKACIKILASPDKNQKDNFNKWSGVKF